MTNTWKRKNLLVLILLLVILVAFVTPVAATTITIDLGKTYQFKATNLSHIKTLDLWDPSASKVEIQTATGDNSDVRVLQQPQINTITRIFTSDTGTFNGNTIHIVGPLTSTIDDRSRPVNRYYIAPSVPNFKVTVPGATGNPFVIKYNESWAKKNSASILDATDAMYLYNGIGIANTHLDSLGNEVRTSLYWTAPLDQNDLNFTLINNRVSLSPYPGNASAASDMESIFPNDVAGPGKYFAGALIHDEGQAAQNTTTIEALTPLVVLNQETPISWTDDYGTHQLPMTYVKGQMGNVTLQFSNYDPTDPPTKIGYVFVNSTAQYTMQVTVDPALLADNANSDWNNLAAPDHIIQILYQGLLNDFGSPFTYNLTAVGQANAPDATQYSQIAITRGYGISGKLKVSGTAMERNITIPAGNFSSLNDGIYYLYLMGTNDKNDTVALSQSTVYIKSGLVSEAPIPTLSAPTPATGTRNTTIVFTVNGNNFPASFGPSGVNVTLTKTNQPTMVLNVTQVTSTKITGTLQTNTSSNGQWNIVLYTSDTGTTISTGAFSIVDSPAPTISSIVNPASGIGYQNSSVNFTLRGAFEPESVLGQQLTFVNMTDKYHPTDVTNITTTMLFVNETTIIGYMGISNLTNKTTTGTKPVTWQFNVSTVDSKVLATKVFTINSNSPPAIKLINIPSPAIFYLNTTPNFTLTGQNFQANSADGKMMTFVNLTNKTLYNINTTILSVNSTTIIGYVNISSSLTTSATGNPWVFNITTMDGGLNTVTTTANTVTISQRPVPTLSTKNPLSVTSSNRNVTLVLQLTGTNFYPPSNQGSGFTNVSFINSFNGNALYLNISSISANANTIIGTLNITKDATPGTYDVVVTTVDGGTAIGESAFTVNYLPLPTFSTSTTSPPLSPTTGYKNSIIPFIVNGGNFQPNNGTVVTFQNVYAGVTLNTNLSSVTPTQITGNLTIPADVTAGSFDLVVMTIDGGTSVKAGAFSINYLPVPTMNSPPLNITASASSPAYKNSTVAFLLSGKYFEPGGTYVRLYLNSTVDPVNAVLTSVSGITINGNFTIPSNQPSGTYRLDLLTADGGSVSKTNYFTISPALRPTTPIPNPASTYQNTTFIMTVTGDNFQTGSDMTNVSLSYSTKQYYMSIISLSKKQIIGTFTIPYDAPYAKGYKLNVTTFDGGGALTPSAFEVKQNLPATVSSISTTTGYQNTTVAFTVTGTNFQTQQGGTNVTFWNKTLTQPLNATVFSISTTQIVGSVFIPASAPTGTWSVNASSVNGGSTISTPTKFTVSPMPKPAFGSITPNTGQAGTDVPFTLVGNYFLPRGGTSVTFLNGTTTLTPTINTIYQTRMIGTLTIPTGALYTGKTWDVNIITADAGSNTTRFKFTSTA